MKYVFEGERFLQSLLMVSLKGFILQKGRVYEHVRWLWQ